MIGLEQDKITVTWESDEQPCIPNRHGFPDLCSSSVSSTILHHHTRTQLHVLIKIISQSVEWYSLIQSDLSIPKFPKNYGILQYLDYGIFFINGYLHESLFPLFVICTLTMLQTPRRSTCHQWRPLGSDLLVWVQVDAPQFGSEFPSTARDGMPPSST